MAEINYRENMRGELVWLKKYFYLLRTVFACRWIIEKKSPTDDAFFQACSCTHDPDILPTVKELMRLKMENLELKAGKRLDIINEYID